MIVIHPSDFLTSHEVAVIRDHAPAAEQLRQLHPSQLEIIYQKKWFQLLFPYSLGGLELSFPEILRLEEALSWADGSLGWTVTLCAGAGWFIGFLNPQLSAKILYNEKVCLGGSGKPNGIAKKIKDGYEISGLWNYSTGAPHTTAFTANCVIEENGLLLRNEKDEPLVMPFLFFRDEVIIHDNWKTMGMIATASQSFEVKNCKVNEERLFIPDLRHAVLDSPIFQYPFMPFAEATLAVNVSGMALRFLELCEVYFKKRNYEAMDARLEKAKLEINNIRKGLYAVAEISWRKCSLSIPIEEGVLNDITKVCGQLIEEARRAINELYPCCGLAALDPSTEINRLWRNLHTAIQHTLLNGCA